MSEKDRKERYAKSGKKSETEHQYYLDHKGEIKANVKARSQRLKEAGVKRESVYNESAKARQQRYYDRQKQKWIDALGGKCIVCGDTDIRHLQIDHINNDGHKEGRQRPPRYLLALSKADSTVYQVLCANCHADKHWELNHREI